MVACGVLGSHDGYADRRACLFLLLFFNTCMCFNQLVPLAHTALAGPKKKKNFSSYVLAWEVPVSHDARGDGRSPLFFNTCMSS